MERKHLPSKYLVNANEFEFIKDIGKGAYGSVKLVKEKKTGKLYAKKVVFFLDGDEMGAPLYFFREFLSLFDSQYPGLPFLYLRGFNFPTKDDEAFIITEYLDGGSLEDLINSNYEGCEDVVTTKMKIIFGIAFALKFLHLKDIIHRDLKPANILLDSKREPYLADFGFAREISKGEQITAGLGTPEYMAPEILDQEYADPDKSIDIYSFAVLTLEIITGSLKINGKNAHVILNDHVKEGKRYDVPNSVPDCFKKLINDCWSGNPSQRWPADDIVDDLYRCKIILPGTNLEVYNEYTNRLTSILEQALEENDEFEVEDLDQEPTPEYDFS